ncbi:glycerol-3-phosphate dehydrogenase [Gigaspora margarita]|uniref:Glycerol-3-phosphate dehydrogenase n=1 Tax=Gigaspora margarita TaxID=4874 RepID=A0A8H4EUB0_GIGMA|nr:glycerol-3-phosphate dehydrogenase [Gigaspora margarita]
MTHLEKKEEIKVLIHGAAGRTARMVITYLLEASTPEIAYKITATINNNGLEDHSDINNPNLTVIKNSFINEAEVKALVSSHDIIIFAAGTKLSNAFFPNKVYSRPAEWIREAIIEAQKNKPGKQIKFIGITGMSARHADKGSLWNQYTFGIWCRPSFDDMILFEDTFLEATDGEKVNYIFLRPPGLTNDIPDHGIQVDPEKRPSGEFRVKRKVLAEFIVKECVLSNKYDGRAIVLVHD